MRIATLARPGALHVAPGLYLASTDFIPVPAAVDEQEAFSDELWPFLGAITNQGLAAPWSDELYSLQSSNFLLQKIGAGALSARVPQPGVAWRHKDIRSGERDGSQMGLSLCFAPNCRCDSGCASRSLKRNTGAGTALLSLAS